MRLRGLLLVLGSLAVILLGIYTLPLLRGEEKPPVALSPPDPTATLEQATEAVKSSRSPTRDEWNRLEVEAAKGDPVAMNNLGVAHWRTRGGKDKAQTWFEKAAAKGDIPARYNLALTLPDKSKTDPEIIQRRLALLQQNVDAGDIPSMAALARSLYYKNREEFVPDREDRRRSLLRQAAASGDADYLATLGKVLWKDLRGGADPALVRETLMVLQQAYDKGDPRGAETIGDILSRAQPDIKAALPPVLAETGIEPDALLWYQRAADMDLITARCEYGFEVFKTRDWTRNPDMSLIERHFRAGPDVLGNSPKVISRAIAELETCAGNPKRTRSPKRPFGGPSLYAYKLRGTYTSMSNQAGWANMTLGVLHGYGITFERDRERAIQYLDIAIKDHGFTIASEIKAALPDF